MNSSVFHGHALKVENLTSVENTLLQVWGLIYPPPPGTYYLIFVVYPILLACCTVGNVTNLIVLGCEKEKGPTNIYLTVVAISDLFVMWLYLPTYLYNIRNLDPYLRTSTSFYNGFQAYYGMELWGQETAMNVGDWILILFSFTRMLAILRPFGFRWLQTTKAAKLISVGLLCLVGIWTIWNPVTTFYKYYHPLDGLCTNVALNETAKTGLVCQWPQWVLRWTKAQNQWETVDIFLRFLALLVINAVMIWLLRRQMSSSGLGKTASQQANLTKKYRNSNILLLSSVALYLITQLPNLTYKAVTVAADDYQYLDLRRTTRLQIGPFTQILSLTNYSVNFFLYVMCSQKFREQFVQIFSAMWCCRRLGVKRPSTTGQSRSSGTASGTASKVQSTKQPPSNGHGVEELPLEPKGKKINGILALAANKAKVKNVKSNVSTETHVP